MGYTRCLSLPVVSGFVLVTFVYYTTVVVVIHPWMGTFTANGLLNTMSYTLWYLMVLWAYSLSIFTDPGGVPAKYTPHTLADEVEDGPGMALQEVKRKGGEPRYCQKCLCHKPPRSHHCRICKRCVLRMDHHCIWINNCVGHKNYKAFVLFVMYDVLALFHGLALLLWRAAACLYPASTLSPAQCIGLRHQSGNLDHTWLSPSPSTSLFCQVVYVIICLPLGVSLLVLLLWHVYLITLNKTTIEMAGGRKVSCRRVKTEKNEDDAPECSGHCQSEPHGHSAGEGAGASACARLAMGTLSRRSLIAMFFVHYEGVRARLRAKAAEAKPSHPYDLGLAENLNVILGPNPFCWICPSAVGYLTSGLRFPTAYDSLRPRLGQDH